MTLALDPPPVTDSPLARLDPRWKLAGLAIAVVATAAVRSTGPAAAALAAALMLTAFARLPPAWLARRIGGLMIALAPFAVVMPLVDGVNGARLAALLALKGTAVVLFVLVGLGSAPLPVNLHAARALHLPGTFIHLLLLSYRYLFVLGDELDRLRRAVRVRGFRPGMDRHSYRTVGPRDRDARRPRHRAGRGRCSCHALPRVRRPVSIAGHVLHGPGRRGISRRVDRVRGCHLGVGPTQLMPDPVIEVCDLRHDYPGGVHALGGVSFTVAAGENVGLVGPNGAGKTTLFLCLAGVLPAPPGAVRVAGLDPAKPAERRLLPARLGVVFQNSDDQLFNSTVFDDVAFGPLNLGLPADEVRKRVAEALDRVGLAGLEERVPFHLSGGEKRRAALAGVLAMRPEVLLLDEPSIFLDPRGRRELIDFARRIARGEGHRHARPGPDSGALPAGAGARRRQAGRRRGDGGDPGGQRIARKTRAQLG